MPSDHTWAPNWFLCQQHWLRSCPGWTWRSRTGPDTAWTCWSWGRASAKWACQSWDGTRSPPWPLIILAAYSLLDLELRPSWKSLSGKVTTHFVELPEAGGSYPRMRVIVTSCVWVFETNCHLSLKEVYSTHVCRKQEVAAGQKRTLWKVSNILKKGNHYGL